MSSKSKRKAAKSLTTLFDKAAIQRLNDQSETADDHLHRYFNSIPSHFKSSLAASQPTKPAILSRKVRRKTFQPNLDRDCFIFPQKDVTENIRLSQGNTPEDEAEKAPINLEARRRNTFAGGMIADQQSHGKTMSGSSVTADKENQTTSGKKTKALTKLLVKEKLHRSLKRRDATTQPKNTLRKRQIQTANNMKPFSSLKNKNPSHVDVQREKTAKIVPVEIRSTDLLNDQPMIRLPERGIENHNTFNTADDSNFENNGEVEPLQPPNKRLRRQFQESPHNDMLTDDKRQKQQINESKQVSIGPFKSLSISNKKTRKVANGIELPETLTSRNGEKIVELPSESSEAETAPQFSSAKSATHDEVEDSDTSESSEEETAPQFSSARSATHDEVEDSDTKGAGTHCNYDGWHFVRTQVRLLREPIMFGGIIKHKYEALVKAHKEKTKDSDASVLEKVVSQVVQRYNKKLLAYHHHHSQSSEKKQERAVAILNELHQIQNSNSTEEYWKSAKSDLNFQFPREIPTQCNASHAQYDKYAELAASIDRLRRERERRHVVLKNILQAVTDLDQVKKADDRYMAVERPGQLVARQHAAQLCSALVDAQAIASILLNNLTDDHR